MTEAEARSPRPLSWNIASREVIAKAINTSASSKAPGPGGIGFSFIQPAYKAIPKRFNQLYRALIITGYDPKI